MNNSAFRGRSLPLDCAAGEATLQITVGDQTAEKKVTVRPATSGGGTGSLDMGSLQSLLGGSGGGGAGGAGSLSSLGS